MMGAAARRIRAAMSALAVGSAMVCPAGAATGEGLVQQVSAGDRLEVLNYAGSIEVTGWDRDEVRVDASLPAGEILLRRSGTRLVVAPASWIQDSREFDVRLPDMVQVRVTGRQPPPAHIAIRAPAWIPITARGPFTDVTVEGLEAPVEVMVVDGDVKVREVRGAIAIVALNGPVLVEDSTGGLRVGGAEGPVTIRRCGGEISAETTSGQVALADLGASRVEVMTVGGEITLSGALRNDATYDLSSHGGDVTVRLSSQPDATFSAQSFQGRVRTNLPVPPGGTAGRLSYTAGDGRGTVRLVTFSGDVSIEINGPE